MLPAAMRATFPPILAPISWVTNMRYPRNSWIALPPSSPCIDANTSRMLDLSAAIREALVDVGVDADNIVDTQLSTVRQNDRFIPTVTRTAPVGAMLRSA